MAKTFTITGTITVEDANGPPVVDQQPPANSTFTFGVAKTIPFGKAHDPNNDPLMLALVPAIAGFTPKIDATGQMTLVYDGKGAIGQFSTAVSIDDGKP
jgi:hypothetical protein